MKIIETLKDCTACIVQENNLIYVLAGMVFINRLPFKITSIHNISNHKNDLYFNDSVTLYKISNDFSLTEVFRVDEVDSLEIISDDILMSFQRISRKELEYKFYNWNCEELWVNNADMWIDVINDNYVKLRDRLDANEKEFTLRDIKNGVPLWHYTLPEGFKIFGSVQAIDNVLFFSCTDAYVRNSKLIVLEIETGKILWEFENLIDFQIDHKNKLLRGYQRAYYQVIDPFEGKLLINKDLKELWNQGIDPDAVRNTITDDKLWFVSGRGENTKFGAIDLATSEIIFIQDFPLENDAQLDKPVYHEGKLYLHDTNNVLYVLE